MSSIPPSLKPNTPAAETAFFIPWRSKERRVSGRSPDRDIRKSRDSKEQNE